MNNCVLFVGPGEDKKSGRVGGITLPFRELENYLLNEIEFLNRFSFFHLLGRNRVSLTICYLTAGFKIVFDRRYQYISLHCTYSSMVFFAPFLISANIFLGKSYTLRKFAGNFDDLFDEANFISKYLLTRLMSRACITFFETKYLVDWASEKGLSVGWWPNSRSAPAENYEAQIEPEVIVRDQQHSRLELVFVGTVSEEKGVFRLKSLAKNVPEVDIVIYGPATDDVLKELLKGASPNFFYKGSVNHDQVLEVIYNADALLVPTAWPAEGYPGVMIEAAQAGTPVICSPARGPKELLNSLSGLGWTVDFDSYYEIKRLLPKVISHGTFTERQKLAQHARRFETRNVLPSVLSVVFKDGASC